MPREAAFTSRLGVEHPIIQAPLAGGGDTPALVAAVAEAGAFGFIGAAYLTPAQIGEVSAAVRKRTARPFGINLFAAGGLPFDEQLAAALESGASAFSFTFGILPARSIDAIKARGMLLFGTATTVEEAVALERAGVDAVVTQGSEAGGHRGTFAGEGQEADFQAGMVGTMALVPQVVDAVTVPVIASGGIMDGRGIAAALVLGASAVQMGTAFLTTDEAGIPDAYKQAILGAREHQTRLTRAFSGRPARGIVNRFMTEVEGAGAAPAILPFPLQNALTRPLRTAAATQGRAEFLSLWAGQGLGLARRQPAAELVARLVSETRASRAAPR